MTDTKVHSHNDHRYRQLYILQILHIRVSLRASELAGTSKSETGKILHKTRKEVAPRSSQVQTFGFGVHFGSRVSARDSVPLPFLRSGERRKFR